MSSKLMRAALSLLSFAAFVHGSLMAAFVFPEQGSQLLISIDVLIATVTIATLLLCDDYKSRRKA